MLARDVFEDSTFETKVKAKSRPVPFRIRMVIGVRIRVLFLFDYCNLWLKWLCLQCFDAVGWAAGRASSL